MPAGTLELDVLVCVEIHQAVVVTEVDADDFHDVKGDTAAYEYVEGLVVLVSLEVVDRIGASADACNTAGKGGLGADAIVQGRTCIERELEGAVNEVEAVVEVNGNVDELLDRLAFDLGDSADKGCPGFIGDAAVEHAGSYTEAGSSKMDVIVDTCIETLASKSVVTAGLGRAEITAAYADLSECAGSNCRKGKGKDNLFHF